MFLLLLLLLLFTKTHFWLTEITISKVLRLKTNRFYFKLIFFVVNLFCTSNLTRFYPEKYLFSYRTGNIKDTQL